MKSKRYREEFKKEAVKQVIGREPLLSLKWLNDFDTTTDI